MTTTTYYELNIVEGTDIVNPLTVDNPNYQKIDETMHNNAVAGVTLATEIANATVHAITRENSDCSVIRFIATSRWKAGDSVTVDGVPVTALLPSGETLPDGAYVINSNVLCILTGTNLTVYAGGKKVENASDIKYKETNVASELDELNASVVQINGNVEQINRNVEQINTNLYALDYANKVDLKSIITSPSSTYTPTKNGVITCKIRATGQNAVFDIRQHGVTLLFVNIYNQNLRQGAMTIVDKSQISVSIFQNIEVEELYYIPFK